MDKADFAGNFLRTGFFDYFTNEMRLFEYTFVNDVKLKTGTDHKEHKSKLNMFYMSIDKFKSQQKS